MKKIDFSKPYGEVFGAGEVHRYEQDGVRFDHDGVEIVDAKAEPDQAADQAPKAEVKKGKGAKAEPDQVDQQLAG